MKILLLHIIARSTVMFPEHAQPFKDIFAQHGPDGNRPNKSNPERHIVAIGPKSNMPDIREPESEMPPMQKPDRTMLDVLARYTLPREDAMLDREDKKEPEGNMHDIQDQQEDIRDQEEDNMTDIRVQEEENKGLDAAMQQCFDFNTGMGWGDSEGVDHKNRHVHLSVYCIAEFNSDEDLSQTFSNSIGLHWRSATNASGVPKNVSDHVQSRPLPDRPI